MSSKVFSVSPMAVRSVIEILLMSFAVSLVEAADLQLGKLGGNIELVPNINGQLEGILWKHSGNKVVEFDGSQNKEFGSFVGRTILDFVTADLIISGLTDEDSGHYELEAHIKGNVQYSRHEVKVIPEVAKLTITCVVNNNKTTATLATLQCSADPQDQQSLMTYKWEGLQGSSSGSILAIPVMDKHDEVVVKCLVSNPVSEKTADFQVKDCFSETSLSVGLAVGLSLLSLLLIILIALGLKYKKHIKEEIKQEDEEKHLMQGKQQGQNRKQQKNVKSPFGESTQSTTLPTGQPLSAPASQEMESSSIRGQSSPASTLSPCRSELNESRSVIVAAFIASEATVPEHREKEKTERCMKNGRRVEEAKDNKKEQTSMNYESEQNNSESSQNSAHGSTLSIAQTSMVQSDLKVLQRSTKQKSVPEQDTKMSLCHTLSDQSKAVSNCEPPTKVPTHHSNLCPRPEGPTLSTLPVIGIREAIKNQMDQEGIQQQEIKLTPESSTSPDEESGAEDGSKRLHKVMEPEDEEKERAERQINDGGNVKEVVDKKREEPTIKKDHPMGQGDTELFATNEHIKNPPAFTSRSNECQLNESRSKNPTVSPDSNPEEPDKCKPCRDSDLSNETAQSPTKSTDTSSPKLTNESDLTSSTLLTSQDVLGGEDGSKRRDKGMETRDEEKEKAERQINDEGNIIEVNDKKREDLAMTRNQTMGQGDTEDDLGDEEGLKGEEKIKIEDLWGEEKAEKQLNDGGNVEEAEDIEEASLMKDQGMEQGDTESPATTQQTKNCTASTFNSSE